MGLGAAALIETLLAEPAPLPEALWLAIQLTAAGDTDADRTRRWALEARLGKLLPIGAFGRLADAKAQAAEAGRLGEPLKDVPRPAIPAIAADKLFAIASAFDEMHLAADAANAYRDAIYGGLAPPGFPDAGPGTWLSPEAADRWLAVARLEAGLGRRGWPFQALLLAAAASPARADRAAEVLGWALGEAPRPPVPDPVPEERKLVRIARLYEELNLHPRGLAALDRLPRPAATSDAGRVRAAIAAAWEALVADYARGAERTSFLFGRKVSGAAPGDLSPALFPYGDVR